MKKVKFKDEYPKISRMDFKSRLQRQYAAIVQDLDVNYILNELFQKEVLSDQTFDKIVNNNNREEQVKQLLDRLIQNGSVKDYEAFHDSLAKDYPWLHEKLIESHAPIMDDSFEDSLSRGNVPRLPDHHVTRKGIENIVAEKLHQLKRHKILVLLGMSGSGKTCVAISTLRDNPELVTNDFNGVVMWLNMGNCKTDDDIVAQQNNLLRKASLMLNTQNSFMNLSVSMSSIGSLGDNSLSALDWTWQELRNKLKTQFQDPAIKECLLVLDEVNDRKCLDALDIGCKILITTRDTEVVVNSDAQIVNIENSLKMEESLQMFASCLDERVSQLPRQAMTLHELCKGSPFNIALIGAQLADNKEKLKHKRRHWDFYVNKLQKKEFLIFTRPNSNPMKTIEVCVSALKEQILHVFKKLAIFPDNVKISAKVISKLWDKDVQEVSSIMKQLKAKSLIIETYDKDQRNYLYEVHDIIMTYLRTCITETEKEKLHDVFLTSYNYTLNNAPTEIVNDGYIAYYVGYHLLKTNNLNGKWGLFNKLFLDLKFLGNKVRLTGPADVIADLKKYEDNIAGNDIDRSQDTDRSLILNIRSFLSTHGTDLYHYPCTDIVQSILQHESAGILFSRASEIAKINCQKNELYFDFIHEQDPDDIKHSTIDVKDGITCITFLGNDLIVGTASGAVKFFDIPTNKLKKELEQDSPRDGPVKWVGVAYSKTPPIVAVLYESGLVRLWYIDDIELEDIEDIIEEEPEETYNNNVGNITIKSKMSIITRCRWTLNEDLLIAQTADMVILYRATGDVHRVIDHFERNVTLMCSVPCLNDRYVAVATAGSRKGVDIIDMNTKERYISFEDPDTETVLDILAVPGRNKIITLKSREITQHEFRINPNTMNKCSTYQTQVILSSFDVKDNLVFLSMVVNKAGTVLYVSTDDSRVICVDLNNNTRGIDLDNRRGNVVTMAVSELIMEDEFMPSADVLLTGTGTIENSAKVWYFGTQSTRKNGKVRLTTKFDVSFCQALSPSSLTSTTSVNSQEPTNQTPKRHQSFANHQEVKRSLKSTLSLDRRGLKPLNLKGICNNNDCSKLQPLLAVIDDKNAIQVIRGRKLLTEILEKPDDPITTVRITPCNQHVIYGLQSGNIRRYTLRTKEVTTILDIYSQVQYMEFVNNNLMMVAGENRCIMAYRLSETGWNTTMLYPGNTHLGSQEILNDIKGVKKKPISPDAISNSSSDISLESKERKFRNDTKKLCKSTGLVAAFCVSDNLITVENNCTIKLWDRDLKMSCVLSASQLDVNVRCAAFKKNILVICDGRNTTFQTYELIEGPKFELNLLKEVQIDTEITSCDLTADGNILALGLRSGNVLIWNVRAKRQITLLRHHTSKVQACAFSPVPARGGRAGTGAGTAELPGTPPLVLVTMATEIVFWDISYDMRKRAGSKSGRPLNAMTPLASPHEPRAESAGGGGGAGAGGAGSAGGSNYFFAEDLLSQHCWQALWRAKTYKEGSKRKDILACIKLTGITSKRLCHDDKFSSFVTVDNTGHIHIMNVINKCT